MVKWELKPYMIDYIDYVKISGSDLIIAIFTL